jgi:hypothetical protein
MAQVLQVVSNGLYLSVSDAGGLCTSKDKGQNVYWKLKDAENSRVTVQNTKTMHYITICNGYPCATQSAENRSCFKKGTVLVSYENSN